MRAKYSSSLLFLVKKNEEIFGFLELTSKKNLGRKCNDKNSDFQGLVMTCMQYCFEFLSTHFIIWSVSNRFMSVVPQCTE